MKVTEAEFAIRPEYRRNLIGQVTAGLTAWGFVPPDNWDSNYDMTRFALRVRFRWGTAIVHYFVDPDNLGNALRDTSVEAMMMEMAADARVPIAEEL